MIPDPLTTVQNCSPQFSFSCPKTWQSLELTNTETIRFCPSCQQNVYLCTTPSEVQAYAANGQCIAFSSSGTYSSLSFPDKKFVMGRPRYSFQDYVWFSSANYLRLLMDGLRNLLSRK